MEEEVVFSQWDGIIKEIFELKEGTRISDGQLLFKLTKTKRMTEVDTETLLTTANKSQTPKLKMEEQEDVYLKEPHTLSTSLQNIEFDKRKMVVYDEFDTQSALPETSELSKPNVNKDLEMNPPVDYKEEEEEVKVEVESDEDKSEFARNYWYKVKHEPLRTVYSHWKCTVHKVLIGVGQELKRGDPCFVLCFKVILNQMETPQDVWGKEYPNDWSGNDFKLDDKKRKEVDEGPDDELKNKKRKLQEEDASLDVAKSLSADSGTSNPVDDDHLLIDGEWQYVYRINQTLKVTELLVKPEMKVKKYQPLFNYECDKAKRVYDYDVPLEKLKKFAIRKGITRFYSEKFGFPYDYVKPNGDPYEPV